MNMADKMAVTDNHSNIPVQSTDTREDGDINKMQGKPSNDGTTKKKSTFKITSITKSSHNSDMSNDAEQEMEHDSLDDLDETVESHTEDASSEILDISKHTDGGEQASPMEEETPDKIADTNTNLHPNPPGKEKDKTEQSSSNKVDQNSVIVKEKEKSEPPIVGPNPTRFKVVKIETKEPFKRGRWICHDTSDIPAPDKSDSKVNIVDTHGHSTSTNVNSLIHSSVDDWSKNPIKSVSVIPGDNHLDNSIVRQSLNTSQPQTLTSNLPNSFAQPQQTQVPLSHQNGVGQSQIHGVVNSYQQGHPSMQTVNTTNVYAGQIPSTMQGTGTSNVDQPNPQYNNTEHYVDNATHTLENKKVLDTENLLTIGAIKVDQDSNEVQQAGAILTPQSVAEVVGIIPSPQEEDRSYGHYTTISPLTPGGRAVVFRESEDQPVDEDGANGSSTVAIDNKIEQAMDLVKSHLMYAVREEVEVLKEQIKELMDKNQQLEYENQILRNSATPETLAKLSNLPPSSSS